MKYQEVSVLSPLRMPLGGGGTDLPFFIQKYGHGFLLVGSIKYAVRVELKRLPLAEFRFKMGQTENRGSSYAELQDLLVATALKYCKWPANEGLEIRIGCEIQPGTGMGFSGAMLVGLLKAVAALQGKEAEPWELAESAYHIEAGLCNRIVGKQDHYGAAIGGIFTMTLDYQNQVKVEKLHLSEEIFDRIQQYIHLYYTGIQRNADTVLRSQGQAFASDEQKSNAMQGILQIGLESKEALLHGDLNRFGYLLHRHWLLKRSITDSMSIGPIDLAYEEAIRHGALGGKLIGAGGGGYLMVCTPPEQKEQVTTRLSELGMQRAEYGFDWEGARVEWLR